MLVYHCKTEESAKKLLLSAHEQGFQWANGHSFRDSPAEWGIYKENTCYDIHKGKFQELAWCKEFGCDIKECDEF